MEQFKFDLPLNNTMAASSLVRQNFEALGRTNYTTDPTYPQNPRNGMLRVYHDENSGTIYFQMYIDNWITLFQTGNATKSARVKEKEFSTPSDTWTFDHNFGNFPTTEILDSTNNGIIPESIVHASVNRVVVHHSSEITGKIIVVG